MSGQRVGQTEAEERASTLVDALNRNAFNRAAAGSALIGIGRGALRRADRGRAVGQRGRVDSLLKLGQFPL
jgi:hypothetical protein